MPNTKAGPSHPFLHYTLPSTPGGATVVPSEPPDDHGSTPPSANDGCRQRGFPATKLSSPSIGVSGIKMVPHPKTAIGVGAGYQHQIGVALRSRAPCDGALLPRPI